MRRRSLLQQQLRQMIHLAVADFSFLARIFNGATSGRQVVRRPF